MGEWLDFIDEVVTVNGKGEEIKREKVTNRGYKYFLSKKTFLEMISIPSGQYLIGAPKSELGWKLSQSPQSPVNIQAFCLSRYPITQRQWREVAKLEPVNIELNPYPAHFEGYDRPVEQINWWEAVEFCDRLSRLTGLNYRLPAEKGCYEPIKFQTPEKHPSYTKGNQMLVASRCCITSGLRQHYLKPH